MKKRFISFPALLSLAVAVLAPAPASAKTDISVNLNVGAPSVVVEGPRVQFQEPPEMVVIPRSTVYFAPGVSVDLFFFNDWWWTRDNGRWYRSREPRTGWAFVGPNRVPQEVIRVRPDYRNYYGHERHVPYGQLKKHWRERDIERRERRGEWRDYKEDRREDKRRWKEEKREDKRDRQDDRRDDREDHGRGHGRD